MAELIHFDKALAGLVAEVDHVTEDELMEIGHFAVALVVARTKKGLDADGKPFVAYTPSYTEERVKHGLQGSPVDLARSGHMLGALIPQRTGPDEVSALFLAPLEATKAAAHNYGVDKVTSRKGNPVHAHTPKREFLDIRLPAEQEAVAEVIGESIASRVEKSIR